MNSCLKSCGDWASAKNATGLQTDGDEEVACALGRAQRQPGRPDVDEALLLHRSSDGDDDGVREPEVPLHSLAPQVEPAVAQTQHLVDALLVELERQRRRRRDDLERLHAQLDLAGREVRVHELGRARHDLALGAQHELVAHVVRDFRSGRRVLGVDDELAEAGVVAEVDEDEAAVIPPAMGPAGERDAPTHVLGPRLAAHHVAPRHGRRPSTTAARSVPASTTTTSCAASRLACVS